MPINLFELSRVVPDKDHLIDADGNRWLVIDKGDAQGDYFLRASPGAEIVLQLKKDDEKRLLIGFVIDRGIFAPDEEWLKAFNRQDARIELCRTRMIDNQELIEGDIFEFEGVHYLKIGVGGGNGFHAVCLEGKDRGSLRFHYSEAEQKRLEAQLVEPINLSLGHSLILSD